MSDIDTIVKEYSEGSSELEETLDKLRQITPAQYETSSPYVDDWVEHDGGYTELFSSCVAFDCTSQELQLFKKALFGNPVYAGRLDTKPEPEEPFDEETVPSLQEILAPDDEGDDPARSAPVLTVDPAGSDDTAETAEEPEEVVPDDDTEA